MVKVYITRRYSFFDDRSRHYLNINGKKQDRAVIPGENPAFHLEKGTYDFQIKTRSPLKSNLLSLNVDSEEEIHLIYGLKTSVMITLVLLFSFVLAIPLLVKLIDSLYLLLVVCISLLIFFSLFFSVFSFAYLLSKK